MAEELPVTETLELLRRLDERAGVPVTGLVVNRWPPPISRAGIDESRRLALGDGPHALLADAAVARARIAEAEVARLDAPGHPLATVPDSHEPLENAIAVLDGSDW